ncbi:BTAD domain-containing putative transcriptional regulator [Rhizohabitans arisaemae]|uniref:BTAD domain-containing putative transcriptional regulator n=1 Tax=Rhizohabitans arisaemae TaxID=2720610 RepID=UPI0024B16D7D|nr:BTAD domain-containing putative transcriptional regulator [Rhizohabitans arisaemae]
MTREGVDLDLGGTRIKALLATLLIAQGRVVTVDRIVEAIWDGRSPESAVGTLHSYVTRLRRTLEPDRAPRTAHGIVDRQGPGYTLRVRPETVDSERFTELAKRGSRLLKEEPLVAAEHLSAALALWRGPAYADLQDSEVAAAEIARLESARLDARQDHAAARLALGVDASVLSDLEGLVREHPLSERAWELLALALYRSGRQGGALAALRTAREHLLEELGVDPGPGLRAMETAVLNQDPELDGAAPRTSVQAVVPRPAPAAPSKSAQVSSIPAPVTRLIGRDDDVAGVKGLLASHRIVTITGPGGSGKTRTAFEAARGYTVAEGPWAVLLADLTDPALLPDLVGTTIGASFAKSTAELTAAIGDREILLVLDNCEHLVDEIAAHAEELVTRCPGLRLLATSREALAIAGEVTWELPPLDPDGAGVELFVERAVSLRPGWRPRRAERELIAEICRSLDGLPLAIELAAAQTRILSLEQIHEGLDDRFDLLSSGSRTAPARHRNLEAVIESSVRLLSEDELKLLGGLALFEGGFDLEAAQWLSDRPKVLPNLRALIAKSLVTTETADTPRRYRLLETIKQYAHRLLTVEERPRWADRHLAWAISLADTAGRRMRSFDADIWMRRLQQEQANMRSALSHAMSTGDVDSALRLIASLSWYWYRTGQGHEGIGWANRALGSADAEHPERGQVLVGRAMLRYLVGDALGGNEDANLASTTAERSGEIEVIARALPYRAYFQQLAGDPEGAQELIREATQLAPSVGLPWIEAEAMMIRGQITRANGDFRLASEQLMRAATIADLCGHEWASVSAWWIAAKVSMDLGDANQAIRQAAHMIILLDRGLDVTSWLAGVHVLAGALGMAGQATQGAMLLGAVEAIGGRVGYSPEAMDPLDGPRNTFSVRSALPEETYTEAVAVGASLSRDDVTAMARRLTTSICGCQH